MVRIVHITDMFGGRDVVEGTGIPAEAILAAHRAGEDEDELRETFPALPDGAIPATLAWAESGRPRGLRVVLTAGGLVVDGTGWTAKSVMSLDDAACRALAIGDDVRLAVWSWIDTHTALGHSADEIVAVADAGAEIWSNLTPAEREADPQIVAVSPCERGPGWHGGYSALVWMNAMASLRIVPILGTGEAIEDDEEAERARLLETGRTILISWQRPERPTVPILERDFVAPDATEAVGADGADVGRTEDIPADAVPDEIEPIRAP